MSDRKFEMKEATREQVPVLVGLSGPSGCGKTYSALRIATGIQEVSGGDIAVIDTEARRALHYADGFKFKHLAFHAPFGSLDYLAAMKHCAAQGAKTIVVDSMSHEHEGPGGMLSAQDAELDRMAGSDWQKREKVKFAAWIRPKADRRALINGMLQIPGNFVFCFRAKHTLKPVKKDGKTEFVQQGFLPIAGEEFVFEMTVHCMLPPASGGVPQWSSEYAGEKQMMKLPQQFRALFSEEKALDEEIGRQLATWAKGGAARPSEPAPDEEPAAEPEREAPASRDDEAEPCWEPLPKFKSRCKLVKGHPGNHIPDVSGARAAS